MVYLRKLLLLIFLTFSLVSNAAKIEVFFFFDTYAVEYAKKKYNGNINLVVAQLITESNQYYKNSNVDIEIVSAGAKEVNYTCSVPQDDSRAVAYGRFDGLIPSGKNPDFKVLITNIPLKEWDYYDGISTTYSVGSKVLYAGVAIRRLDDTTLVHELGHLMGLAHSTTQKCENGSGKGSTYYAYGYQFKAKNKRYHTIMAYNFDGETQKESGNSYTPTKMFSNPNIIFKGEKMGSYYANCARLLNEQKLSYARIGVNKTPKIIEQTKNIKIKNVTYASAYVQMENTSTSYTFQWLAYKNYNWITLSGSGSSITLNKTQLNTYKKLKCVVKGGGYQVTSDEIPIVSSTIAIESHPISQTVYEKDTVTLSVSAISTSSSGNLSYQWQVNKGNGWENLKNKTASISIKKISNSYNGYKYRCIISNQEDTEYSNEAIIYVRKKAKIVTQSKTVNTYEGGYAEMYVSATGYDLQYQWQRYNTYTKDWDNITGANSQYYSPIVYSKNKYRCVVSNTKDNLNYVTTKNITVEVKEKVRIVESPKDIVVQVGKSAKFTGKASGFKVKYQWQTNYGGSSWYDIPKATSKNLTLKKLDKSKDGYGYRLRVYNDFSTDCSAYATLSVKQPTIFTPKTKKITAFDDAESVSIVMNVKAETPFSYIWERKMAGQKNFTQCVNDSKTIPSSIYDKENGIDLTLTDKPTNINYKNASYRLYINGQYSKSVSLDILSAPSITKNLPYQTIAKYGKKLTLSIKVTGKKIKYQWYKNGYPIAKATKASYTISKCSYSDLGEYYCSVRGEVKSGSNVISSKVYKSNTTNVCTEYDIYSGYQFYSNKSVADSKEINSFGKQTTANKTISENISLEKSSLNSTLDADAYILVNQNNNDVEVVDGYSVVDENIPYQLYLTKHDESSKYNWYVSDDDGINWILLEGENNSILTINNVEKSDILYQYICEIVNEKNTTITLPIIIKVK